MSSQLRYLSPHIDTDEGKEYLQGGGWYPDLQDATHVGGAEPHEEGEAAEEAIMLDLTEEEQKHQYLAHHRG